MFVITGVRNIGVLFRDFTITEQKNMVRYTGSSLWRGPLYRVFVIEGCVIPGLRYRGVRYTGVFVIEGCVIPGSSL